MITEFFGKMPSGEEARLYTISCGGLTAAITDHGATLVRLLVPDRHGNREDVVLGYNDISGYRSSGACLGATIGRNANRIGGAAFPLMGRTVQISKNENGNNLHSGPLGYQLRLWKLERHTDSSLTFRLDSPNGDQGFPGNAVIRVTYSLEHEGILRITYEAVSDADTVFNMTNHSYFNLAGHRNTEKAIHQLLTLPGRTFNPDDAQSIPTGEARPVEGTPMDFRSPKPISRDLDADYEPLKLQRGYDHNWEVFCNPCAILRDPDSGRTLAISTDCPGIQFYSGNYLEDPGKDGVFYGTHAGIALETQFWPDSVNHPEWKQPFVKAGQKYRSETVYRFTIE